MKKPSTALKTRKQMNSNTMLLIITIILFVVLYAGDALRTPAKASPTFRPSSTCSVPMPASSAWPAV